MNGSVKDGERALNFCWYSNCPLESLASLTTDTDGHRHHATVPRGKVRQEVWDKQRRQGAMLLPEPFKEVMEGVKQPFIQVIMDYHSPKASFCDGKVLLVGDALTLFRPHIAFSTNQAAFDCQNVEILLIGDIDAAEWEHRVIRFAYLHRLRSIWFGAWFQTPIYVSCFAAIRYWTAAVKNYLGG